MHVNGDEILAYFPDLHKELTLNHKLKNDLRVITPEEVGKCNRWDIWLDLQILFQTFPAVIKMRGAY